MEGAERRTGAGAGQSGKALRSHDGNLAATEEKRETGECKKRGGALGGASAEHVMFGCAHACVRSPCVCSARACVGRRARLQGIAQDRSTIRHG